MEGSPKWWWVSQLECRPPFPITPCETLEQVVLALNVPKPEDGPEGRSGALLAVISTDTLVTSEAATDGTLYF